MKRTFYINESFQIFIGNNIFNLLVRYYVSICSFPAEMQIFVFKNRKSSITYAKIIYLLSQIHVQRHILSATNVRKTFDTIAIYKWCRNKHIKRKDNILSLNYKLSFLLRSFNKCGENKLLASLWMLMGENKEIERKERCRKITTAKSKKSRAGHIWPMPFLLLWL